MSNKLPPLQTDDGQEEEHPSYPAEGGGRTGATITTGTGVPPSSVPIQPGGEEEDGLGEMKSLVSVTAAGFSRPATVLDDPSAWVEKTKATLPWTDDLRRWRGNNPATSKQIARKLRNVCAPK